MYGHVHERVMWTVHAFLLCTPTTPLKAMAKEDGGKGMKLLQNGALVFVYDPETEALTHAKFIAYIDEGATMVRLQKMTECMQRGLRLLTEYTESAEEFVKPMFSRVTARLLRTHTGHDNTSINTFAAKMFQQYSSLQRLGFQIATEKRGAEMFFPKVTTVVISPYKRNCLEAAFRYVLYDRLQPQTPRLEDMSRATLVKQCEQLRAELLAMANRVHVLESAEEDVGSKRLR